MIMPERDHAIFGVLSLKQSRQNNVTECHYS